MKTKVVFLSIFCIFSFIIVQIIFPVPYKEEITKTSFFKPLATVLIPKPAPGKNDVKRENITFILGKDKEADNPYYTEASNYYLFNETGKTEYVITTCLSLLDVRNYLEKNPPVNDRPWGLINLVSHGNQWLGLSVKVTPESKRATSERINENINNGTFKPLPNHLADDKTKIIVHGCGIGNNHELINTIAKAFGGDDTIPSVMASKLFEYYTSVKNNGVVTKSERYVANAWFVTYKMGYKPEAEILCRQLKTKYPDVQVDWQDALNRQQPRFIGDTYSYTFEVPVKWIISYPNKDSLPDLSSKQDELNWIKEQQEIVQALNKIEIPAEKFNWWFRNVYINNEDGSKSPAVWVKGYCTILTIIQPLVDDKKNGVSKNSPFIPKVDDEKYYYSVF